MTRVWSSFPRQFKSGRRSFSRPLEGGDEQLPGQRVLPSLHDKKARIRFDCLGVNTNLGRDVFSACKLDLVMAKCKSLYC